MSKRGNPLSKIKLIYRSGKTLTKVALLGVIVVSTATLVLLHSAIANGREQLDASTAQAAKLEHENRELERSINALGSQESILEIAEKKLGLVDPDTVVFVPDN